MRLPPFAVRMAWFIGLWLAGVALVSLVAYAIRLVLMY